MDLFRKVKISDHLKKEKDSQGKGGPICKKQSVLVMKKETHSLKGKKEEGSQWRKK